MSASKYYDVFEDKVFESMNLENDTKTKQRVQRSRKDRFVKPLILKMQRELSGEKRK